MLTKHYFNETIAKVIDNLFKYDQASIGLIRMTDPSLKTQDLKKALIILIKYQLVDYNRTIKSCDYIVPLERLFAFFRLPKFLQTSAAKDGEPTARLLKILAEMGTVGLESLLDISSKGQKESRDEMKDILESLSANKYVSVMNKNVYMQIERFNRDYRDDLITETVENFYNKETNVKLICATILKLSLETTGDDAAITAPVDLTSLHNNLKTTFKSKVDLEAYLSKLTCDINYRFFMTSGTHPQRGPMYALNVGLVIDYLLKEHVCSMISLKYGPKCCRLFRILLIKGPLLLKQIEDIIMLPARDVREYVSMLNKENLVRNRQVPRTPDNAPGKSVFILSVEMDPIVYTTADLCCRSMHNLLRRYEFELSRNEALLTRMKAVEELLGTSQQTDEWNQYFNSHELVELNSTLRNLHRLLLARNQVDDTLFLCHTWLTIRKNMEST